MGRRKEEPQKPYLFIGTPAYGGWVHYRYMFTILELATRIPIYVQVEPWAALVTMSRNDIINAFYQDAERMGWTHLLWLDADVAVSADGILRLLSHGKDAIAARVPLKAHYDPMKYSVRDAKPAENGLYEVDAAATGCFLLSRRAVFALCEDAKAKGRVYRVYNTANPAYYRDVIDVFTVGIRNGEYDTEDWAMCHTLQELGFKIYVDPTVRVSHFGMCEFRGEGGGER